MGHQAFYLVGSKEPSLYTHLPCRRRSTASVIGTIGARAFAAVAQSAEQLICNQSVGSSILLGGSKSFWNISIDIRGKSVIIKITVPRTPLDNAYQSVSFNWEIL